MWNCDELEVVRILETAVSKSDGKEGKEWKKKLRSCKQNQAGAAAGTAKLQLPVGCTSPYTSHLTPHTSHTCRQPRASNVNFK